MFRVFPRYDGIKTLQKGYSAYISLSCPSWMKTCWWMKKWLKNIGCWGYVSNVDENGLAQGVVSWEFGVSWHLEFVYLKQFGIGKFDFCVFFCVNKNVVGFPSISLGMPWVDASLLIHSMMLLSMYQFCVCVSCIVALWNCFEANRIAMNEWLCLLKCFLKRARVWPRGEDNHKA